MRSLMIQAGAREGDYIPVHWRLDTCEWQGRLLVRIAPEVADEGIVAELCALHFLAVGTKTCGGGGPTAKIAVTVSFGAIKKLAQQDSEKGHLVPFARFLFFALNGRQVDVKKKGDWVTKLPVRQEARLAGEPPPAVLLDVPAVGKVRVTRHAVERYIERNLWREHCTQRGLPIDTPVEYDGRVGVALAGMERMLVNAGTKRVDKRPSGRQLSSDGKEGFRLVHAPSGFAFVFVEDAGELVLSTFTEHHDWNAKQAVYAGGKIEMRSV